MNTVRETLIKAKADYVKRGIKGIYASFALTVEQGSPGALETLVALRKALPEGFTDFDAFERSNRWRFKEGCKVFDRAIAEQPEA